MRNLAKALAFIAGFIPAIAAAQVYLPPGVGLPPRSVIGNALPQGGNAVAVPFSQLQSGLGVPALKTCSTSTWFSSLTAGGVLGCTQPAVTDISGFGSGVAAWLTSPTSANLRAALIDETGTGAAVFATGPTLVNPALGTPSALVLTNATGLPISTGVNGLGTGVATALGTNTGSPGAFYIIGGALGTPSSGVATNLTGTAAGLTAGTATTANGFTAGSASNLNAGTLPAARTNGHQNGTATNDSAAAGEIGELIESNITSGSPVAAGATNTGKSMTSITLTPGDWDVSGTINWVPLSTTVLSAWSASISATNNTVDSTNGRWNIQTIPTGITGSGNTSSSSPVVPTRFSVASNTTIYIVGTATYTTAGLNMYGNLRARRKR